MINPNKIKPSFVMTDQMIVETYKRAQIYLTMSRPTIVTKLGIAEYLKF